MKLPTISSGIHSCSPSCFFDRNASTIVLNGNLTLLGGDFEVGHTVVPSLVVRCVDENLIDDLVEARGDANLLMFQSILAGVDDPLGDGLDRGTTHVDVGPLEDVLVLGEAAVGLSRLARLARLAGHTGSGGKTARGVHCSFGRQA